MYTMYRYTVQCTVVTVSNFPLVRAEPGTTLKKLRLTESVKGTVSRDFRPLSDQKHYLHGMGLMNHITRLKQIC